jgi:hypothetical protein
VDGIKITYGYVAIQPTISTTATEFEDRIRKPAMACITSKIAEYPGARCIPMPMPRGFGMTVEQYLVSNAA